VAQPEGKAGRWKKTVKHLQYRMSQSQSEKNPKLLTLEDLEKESLEADPSFDKDGNLILEDGGFRLVILGDGPI
jgi:hypothetical protein